METACEVYTKLLWQRGHGHPLWEPEPTDAGEVLIGDVGHIFNGGFYRIFNATLPKDHPVNKNCGVPEGYVPFSYPPHLHQRRQHALAPGPLCSRSVLVTNVQGSLSVNTNASGGMRFKCADEQGAVLVLKHEGNREVLLPCRTLTQYILHNHPRWYQFARDVCLLDIREEDLIFVRGWVKTGGWAVAAATHSAKDGEIEFSGNFGAVANAAFTVAASKRVYMSIEHRTGPIIPGGDKGPSPGTTQEDDSPKFDQCVFLHYYRFKRRVWFGPSVLKAAADPVDGPPPHDDSGRPSAPQVSDKALLSRPGVDHSQFAQPPSTRPSTRGALDPGRELNALDATDGSPCDATAAHMQSAAAAPNQPMRSIEGSKASSKQEPTSNRTEEHISAIRSRPTLGLTPSESHSPYEYLDDSDDSEPSAPTSDPEYMEPERRPRLRKHEIRQMTDFNQHRDLRRRLSMIDASPDSHSDPSSGHAYIHGDVREQGPSSGQVQSTSNASPPSAQCSSLPQFSGMGTRIAYHGLPSPTGSDTSFHYPPTPAPAQVDQGHPSISLTPRTHAGQQEDILFHSPTSADRLVLSGWATLPSSYSQHPTALRFSVAHSTFESEAASALNAVVESSFATWDRSLRSIQTETGYGTSGPEVEEVPGKGQVAYDPMNDLLDHILQRDGVTCALVSDEDLTTLYTELPLNVAESLHVDYPEVFVDANGVGMLPAHDQAATCNNAISVPLDGGASDRNQGMNPLDLKQQKLGLGGKEDNLEESEIENVLERHKAWQGLQSAAVDGRSPTPTKVTPVAPAWIGSDFLTLFSQVAQQCHLEVQNPATCSTSTQGSCWAASCVVSGIERGIAPGTSADLATEEAVRQAFHSMRRVSPDAHADSGHAEHVDAAQVKATNLVSAMGSPKQLQITQMQTFVPTDYYAWFYEGSQWTTYLGGVAMVAIMLAGVMFPLWPPIMRLGVWYLSIGVLGLIGFFYALAVVRLFFYIITFIVASPAILIFPELFADVGFMEAFIPLWEWNLPKKKGKKRRSKKGKGAASGSVSPVPSARIEEVQDSGSSRPASRTTVRVKEILDEDRVRRAARRRWW